MKRDFFAVLAEAFHYPAPGRLDRLQHAVRLLPESKEQKLAMRFLKQIETLDLGEWEELYTRTWDLNPAAAPYLGHHLWGEQYRRGAFMAQLRQAYRETGVPPEGELPDHLVLVLAYLGMVDSPLPDLVEGFPIALEKMAAELRKADHKNPYLFLLDALRQVEWAAVIKENQV